MNNLKSAQWAYDNAEPMPEPQYFYDHDGEAYTVVDQGVKTITLRDSRNQEFTIDLDVFHSEYEAE